MEDSKGRTIGIHHRMKWTVDGTARPTQLVIQDGDLYSLKLETEDDELDFVRGQFPISFRKIKAGEDLSAFRPHHIKRRRVKPDEDLSKIPASHLFQTSKGIFVATQVPETYDGLRKGDQVAMMLGGSGDRLAFALANRGSEIGASVYRVPAHLFVEIFGKERDKNQDAEWLVQLFQVQADVFYKVTRRELDVIWVRETFVARLDAMKARMACEQRLRARAVGRIFCSQKGYYPEGQIEDMFDEIEANDAVLASLKKEEAARNKDLAKACKDLDLYLKLFEPIPGMGPAIAGRIISIVIDIRRFPTVGKFRKYCGLHVTKDGKFPRRRRRTKDDLSNPNNWQPELRQAFYLFAGQLVYKPNTPWGQKLIEAKVYYRKRHPEVVVVNGKKRYTDGHIHKMAIWKTLSEFAEWLFYAWWTYAM